MRLDARCLMLVAPVAALLYVATCGVGAEAAAQASEPWAGRWRLDLARSRYSPGPPPRSTVNRVESRPGGILTANDTVAADGTATHTEIAASFDGREHPLKGAAVPTTRAYTRTEDGFQFVVRERGAVTVTTRIVLSRDGRTLTATSTGTDRAGRSVNNLQVFERH